MPQTLPNLESTFLDLDRGFENFLNFDTGDQMRVNIFLVPKRLLASKIPSQEELNKSSVLLKYMEEVESITLTENLGVFGLGGTMNVIDRNGSLAQALMYHNLYYLVINISTRMTDDHVIKFEPFVCEITKVFPQAVNGNGDVRTQVSFVDYLTHIMQSHNFISLVKFFPYIAEATSYHAAFQIFMEYLQKYINLNTFKHYTFEHELRYRSVGDGEMPEMVKKTFQNISPNATVYEAFSAYYKDAAVGLNSSDYFQNQFNTAIGSIKIPMYFRAEFPDFAAAYDSAFGTVDEATSTLVERDNEGSVFHRSFNFRNMMMPFTLAFSSTNHIISESICPYSKNATTTLQNDRYYTMNGATPTPLTEYVHLPLETTYTDKTWKNIVFVSEGDNVATNCLIYFNWIYQYFNNNFLNIATSSSGNFSSSVPDFFLISRDMGYVDEHSQNDYSELNANTVVLKTPDVATEIAFHIGKTLSKLVTMSDAFTFAVNGSMFRRPNEIIKVNCEQGDENHLVPFFTTTNRQDYVLLFVSQVTHEFVGTSFKDNLFTNRVYDSV